jgi:hypothetical protein
MNRKHIPYYILTAAIMLGSFFLYSSAFYPLLNSDDALNILMAHYYKLPHDFYCWGQDRGGTLIPLISQIFIKLGNCSALTAVSLSNYLILILGFIGFSSLIESKYYKIILAIIWFFPFERFIDLVRFPIGVEYGLIGFSIFLIRKLQQENTVKRWKKHALLTGIVLTLIVSVWVSDLASVTIGVLLLTLLLFHFVKNGKRKINKTVLIYGAVGVAGCGIFIPFAKSFAALQTENYLAINTFDRAVKAFSLVAEGIGNMLAFDGNETPVGLYSWAAVVFIALLLGTVAVRRKRFVSLSANPWIVFFLADTVVIFGVFLFASWVLDNGMGKWYFVATYISFSLFILLTLDGMERRQKIRFLRCGALLVSLLGAVSTVWMMKYVHPKTLKPKADIVGEFQQLGEIGIIAEFWHAYVSSCPNPEQVIATQRDQWGVRNQEIVDRVMERKNLYVISDDWMDVFPDTLEQFGYMLRKDGQPFYLGGCNICKYDKIKLRKSFSLPELIDPDRKTESENIYDGKSVFVSADCDSCKEKFILSGHYMQVGAGEFRVRFKLRAGNFTNESPVARLDLMDRWGSVRLVERKIDGNDFLNADSAYIDLDFATSKRLHLFELRMYYYGNADLYVDQITLQEK